MQQRPRFEKIPVQKLTLQEKIIRFIKDVIVLAFTGGIIYGLNTFDVMINSKRVYRELLYVALSFHGAGALIATYMTWVTAKTDPDFESDESWRKVQVTTGCLGVGTLLWTIAVWPVFHFWTLLLGLCFLFFIVTAVSMISVERPKPKVA